MTESQKQLIQILAKNLFDKSYAGNALDIINKNDPNALREVINEAKKQAVFSIVFSSIKEQAKEALSEVEYEKNEKLSMLYRANAVRNLSEHSEISRLLLSRGLVHVFIKGVASASYYPDPFLRTSGDVDLLIMEKDLRVVNHLMLDNGFCKRDHAESHHFHWAYYRNKTVVEIHWKIPGLPSDDHIISKYVSSIFVDSISKQTISGVIPIPTEFHHGLIILLHTLSHMTSTGIGLRHLCDWLVFVEGIDDSEFANLFEKPLKDIGLWRFAKALTNIGEYYFGCRKHVWCDDISEELCNYLLEEILDSGNFGTKDDGRRKIQSKMIRNTSTRKIERKSIRRNLVSNVNSRARKKHPIVVKCPLLLPLGWASVGAEFLMWSNKKKNPTLILKAYSEAQKRQAMFADLKLFEEEKDSDLNS